MLKKRLLSSLSSLFILFSLVTPAGVALAGHTNVTITAGTPTSNGSGGYTLTVNGTGQGHAGSSAVKWVRVFWGDGNSNTSFGSSVNESFSGTGNFSGPWSGTHTYSGSSACVVAASCTVTVQLWRDFDFLDSASTTVSFAPSTGTLTVEKVVVDTDNIGTSALDDFSFSLNAGTPVAFEADGTNDIVLNDGDSYAVVEANTPPGYTSSLSGCSGTMTGGGTPTCTITNTAVRPTLTVNKVVHGGPYDGNPVPFNVSIDGGTTPVPLGIPQSLVPGTYTVTELTFDDDLTVDPEYVAVFVGNCNGTNQVSLNFGDTSAVCTVHNVYAPACVDDPTASGCYLLSASATLTVKKIVTTDDGGTDTAGDFDLTVSGSSDLYPDIPFESTFTGLVDTILTLLPGTYTVSEPADPRYTPSFSTDCPDGEVTLTAGGNATCTVTNDDVPGTLIVIKEVVGGPEDGNSAAFQISVAGPTPSSFAGLAAGEILTVSAGTYTITETGPAGYVPVYSGDCNGINEVTIGNGESKTCTITNKPTPTITVTKVVINNGLGTATVADFPLLVCEASSFGGTQQVCTTVVSGETNTFTPGDYFVDEIYDDTNGVNGVGYYSNFTGDCGGSGNITLSPGDNLNCTITNDDFTGPSSGGGASSGGGGGGGSVLGESITQETTEGDGGGNEGEEEEGGEEENGDGGEEEEEETVEEEPVEEEEQGEVLQETTCTPYITSYIHINKQNDSGDVTRLQNFLNNFLGLSLGASGVYDQGTFNAVKQLQSRHSDEILRPWGISQPTGYVYITTRRFINMEQCKGMQFDPGPLPPLVRDTNINDNQ